MLSFNPTSPEYLRNPYPTYDRLRSNSPIAYWPDDKLWILTRWSDCHALLRDKRFGNDPVGKDMLFQNPPDHTRLRALVQKAFTRRQTEKMHAQAQTITDGLLAKAAAKGQWDVIADLAFPLPLTMIATMLGVPTEEHKKFHHWSNAFAGSMELVREPGWEARLAEAEEGFYDFFYHLIRQRRADPQDDLLTAMIAVEEAGDRLTYEELYLNAKLLLMAGYETVAGMLGNSIYALLRNPAQWQLLRQQPELLDNAVEELIRYDTTLQIISRKVLETIEWQGFVFEKGQEVGFFLGAANRDPDQFTNPNTLDITRTNVQHLSFGGGIHYCLGTPLARLEGQIAIGSLMRKFPKLKILEENPPYRPSNLFRGLLRLPVAA